MEKKEGLGGKKHKLRPDMAILRKDQRGELSGSGLSGEKGSKREQGGAC